VVMSACADFCPPDLLTMMNSVALPRLALMRPPRASPVYLQRNSATTNDVKGAYTHNAMASVPYPSIPASGTIPMSATAKMAFVTPVSDAPSAIPEQADVRQESGPCNAAPTRPGSRGAAHSATRTWRAQSGSLLCPAPSAVRPVSPPHGCRRERARTRCDAGLMNRLFVTRRENGGGRVRLSMGVAVAVGAGSDSGSGDAVAVRSDTGGRWPGEDSITGRVQAARGAASEVVGALR
jgi:hypothetical protein